MNATITTKGVDEAAKRAQERAKRLANMTPVMRVIGEGMVSEAKQAFQKQVSPAGEKWDDLAASTKGARLGRRKATQVRGKQGKARERAKGLRAAALGKGFRALMDTGRAMGSIRAKALRRGLILSMVGYLRPHITGNPPDLPKRNPLPIEWDGARWIVIPRLRRDHMRRFVRWIDLGRTS